MTASKIIAFILRRLNLKLLDLIAKIKYESAYKILYNFFSFLFAYKSKITSNDIDFIKVKDKKSDISLIICHRNRINYYTNSIDVRLNNLAEEYFLNNINIYNKNIVFDVGSNIGELGVYLRNKYKKKLVYSPGPFHFLSCQMN